MNSRKLKHWIVLFFASCFITQHASAETLPFGAMGLPFLAENSEIIIDKPKIVAAESSGRWTKLVLSQFEVLKLNPEISSTGQLIVVIDKALNQESLANAILFLTTPMTDIESEILRCERVCKGAYRLLGSQYGVLRANEEERSIVLNYPGLNSADSPGEGYIDWSQQALNSSNEFLNQSAVFDLALHGYKEDPERSTQLLAQTVSSEDKNFWVRNMGINALLNTHMELNMGSESTNDPTAIIALQEIVKDPDNPLRLRENAFDVLNTTYEGKKIFEEWRAKDVQDPYINYRLELEKSPQIESTEFPSILDDTFSIEVESQINELSESGSETAGIDLADLVINSETGIENQNSALSAILNLPVNQREQAFSRFSDQLDDKNIEQIMKEISNEHEQ